MSLEAALNELQGTQLGSVEFVRSYVQFHFDGPTLNAYTLPSVLVNRSHLVPGDSGYRDALCERIGIPVARASVSEILVTLVFQDEAIFSISLRSEDYVGAEAVEYVDRLGRIWVG